jgi:hypothetical protein
LQVERVVGGRPGSLCAGHGGQGFFGALASSFRLRPSGRLPSSADLTLSRYRGPVSRREACSVVVAAVEGTLELCRCGALGFFRGQG